VPHIDENLQREVKRGGKVEQINKGAGSGSKRKASMLRRSAHRKISGSVGRGARWCLRSQSKIRSFSTREEEQ